MMMGGNEWLTSPPSHSNLEGEMIDESKHPVFPFLTNHVGVPVVGVPPPFEWFETNANNWSAIVTPGPSHYLNYFDIFLHI